MDIRFAVDYTIDILKGLEYIHSKGLIHSDIIGLNVMIVGPRAIIIDTTGARNPSCPRSLGYLRDVENAIKLLNNMLWNNTTFSPEPWKASDEDRCMFNKKTLKKLEKLLKRQDESLRANSKSPMMDTIETLLQDLGIISEELKGLRQPSDSPDSSEDEAYQSYQSDANQKAQLEAYKAEIERERELRKKAERDRMKAEQDRMKAEQENKKLHDKMDALLAKLEMEPKDNGQEGP
ncbi:PREDICTED: uncharacterized protein LOC109482443 isoform X2 [Branchiostoma belcheri]|nr:PREDICTED: uncharacterized protein LOC109482443 isoform X2 [Branchiostoma belcheri]